MSTPSPTPYDVLVVGAGHAGCEAAFAAARMGCKTLLITAQRDTLGLMPCNPAIGGLAKSHLVVELDALGGEMGLNADLTGLQYRTLNASRGPAVRAVRIQCDKAAYSQRLAQVADSLPTLTLLEGLVTDLLLDPSPTPPNPLPRGVILADGRQLLAKTIVITSGTTLGGRIWIGHTGRDGGGDARPAIPLPETLQNLSPNLQWRRLKTGTPPRLWNHSIQWSAIPKQPGETDPIPFFSRRAQLAQQREAELTVDSRQTVFSANVPRGTSSEEYLLSTRPQGVLTGVERPALPRCRASSPAQGVGVSPHNEQINIQSSPVPRGTLRVGDTVTFGETPHSADQTIWQYKEGCATYRAVSESIKPLPSLENELKEALERAKTQQLPCFTTHTTLAAHQIIRDNLQASALYGGEISGEGVRYCPSIEDKIVKFGDRGGHHIILEPEGAECPWCYPNGLSNSLPEDVQRELVHAIPGLEQAEFAAYAYAIEYECIDPRALDERLSLPEVPNLYFAGQINGTTGYEEAAAQGFYAGVNAALWQQGRGPFVLSRDEAYIGVMVDDLITKGADEPYRMFTSRAERRLLLRPGNAHLRLHAHAKRLGIVSPELLDLTEREALWLEETERAWRTDYLDGRGLSRWKLLAREGISFAQAATAAKPGAEPPPLPAVPPDWQEELSLRAKYEGYIAHEAQQAQRLKQDEAKRIPPSFDYAAVRGLRFEAREKLQKIRPETLRRAASIPGVNPADIALLAIALKAYK
ncbi:MAG: tRNA uridine-5-carboxymethylaminomethyl modification enzyme MnmG/GidA [Candidatus Spyradenecus sp.]